VLFVITNNDTFPSDFQMSVLALFYVDFSLSGVSSWSHGGMHCWTCCYANLLVAEYTHFILGYCKVPQHKSTHYILNAFFRMSSVQGLLQYTNK